MRPNRQSRSICFRNSARASAGSLSKVAESSGPASQASRLETASNRSPPFAVLLSNKKMAEARGHAPQRPNVARSASNRCRHLGRFRLRSPRGRICTCVDPLRRRRPELLGHAEKVDLAAGLPPTTQRSKRCMIVISPREEIGPPAGNCTRNSAFAEPCDSSFTTGRKLEPDAGVAPASSCLQNRHVAHYV